MSMDRRPSHSSTRSPHSNPSRRPSDPPACATKRARLNPSTSGTVSGTGSGTGSWTSTPNTQTQSEEEPEFIDLREDDSSALSKALSKQREDAVRSQQDGKHEEGRSPLTAYKCPVCMDTPEDATSTVCGHLFCHKCIIDTLKFSESQRSDSSGKASKGTCPVCRKPLSRSDAPGPKRSLVPLQLKLVSKKKSPVLDIA